MPQIRLFRSTAFRLAMSYAMLFAGSALVLVGFIYWATAGYMDRQTIQIIRADVESLAGQYRQRGIAEITGEINNRLADDDTGTAVYVLADPAFKVVAGNLDSWPVQSIGDREGWFEMALSTGDVGPQHIARVRHFLLPEGFHLLVGRDINDWLAVQSLILNALAGSLVITLLLAGGGAFVARRVMLRRIDQINRTSEQIMHGDLKRRVPSAGTGDEFDLLAESINRMLDQIEQLMDGIRHVSNNIAHDLRSPLARMRSRLERVLMEPPDLRGYRTLTERTIADVDALLAVFSALLRIAQAESGARRAAFEPVRLDELAADAVDLYIPVAEEKGLTMAVDVQPGVTVTGDRHMLSQAVANLLDNAIKYTPAGGSVRLNAGWAGQGAEIVVADSGPGIPPEARGMVVERFARLEASRTTAGSGLGLTLVAAVAKLHNGSLTFGDNHPGLIARLSLP